MTDHPVVSREEWLSARTSFLAKEKEFTRLRDEMSRQRRELPWVLVDAPYRFETPGGERTLAELFDGRRQLAIYHFMFSPEWDEGCPHCSFWADNFDGIDVHLHHRDVTFLAVSRAPLEKIERFKARMGWSFPWVSSFGQRLQLRLSRVVHAEGARARDRVLQLRRDGSPGRPTARVSARSSEIDDGSVFHTYSCYARGIDILNGAYNFLDLMPMGRDEDGLADSQDWVRHHDRYD